MKIIIDGEPVSQIRMKYSGRNGIGRIYDPREKIKKEIKKDVEKQCQNHCLISHPRVSFVFHMPIPKSTPKKLLEIYNSGLLKHEKKPDIDNLVKLYLDCIDTYILDGDEEVQLGPCVKLYHPHPKTIIFITEASDIISTNEIDKEVWDYLFS